MYDKKSRARDDAQLADRGVVGPLPDTRMELLSIAMDVAR